MHLFNFIDVIITTFSLILPCSILLFILLYFLQHLLFLKLKNAAKSAIFYIMVELPDTASGSEISLGHNSTRIVPCFVLAEIISCKKQN